MHTEYTVQTHKQRITHWHSSTFCALYLISDPYILTYFKGNKAESCDLATLIQDFLYITYCPFWHVTFFVQNQLIDFLLAYRNCVPH